MPIGDPKTGHTCFSLKLVHCNHALQIYVSVKLKVFDEGIVTKLLMVHSGKQPMRAAIVFSFCPPVNYTTISFLLYSTVATKKADVAFKKRGGRALSESFRGHYALGPLLFDATSLLQKLRSD